MYRLPTPIPPIPIDAPMDAASSSSRKLDLPSVRALVSAVASHFLLLLSDPSRLRFRLSAALSAAHRRRPSLSEHHVLSSLYWGSHHALSSGRLRAAERLLQIPALLDEHGATAGLPNRFLVCFSYFCLAAVRKLRGDDWQLAVHFLQAVLVSPRDVRMELAPELCSGLWPCGEGEALDEAMRAEARRYKDRLMYYQVVSLGETPRWIKGCAAISDSGETEGDTCNFEPVDKWPVFQEERGLSIQLVPANKNREKGRGGIRQSIAKILEQRNFSRGEDSQSLKGSGEVYCDDSVGGFDITRLQEMLEDSQSDSSSDSFYSQVGSEESDVEVKVRNKEISVKTLLLPTDFSTCDIADRTSEEQEHSPCSFHECMELSTTEARRYSMRVEACGFRTSYLLSSERQDPTGNLNLSVLDIRDVHPYPSYNCYMDCGTPPEMSPAHDFRCFGQLPSKLFRRYGFAEFVPCGTFARRRLNFACIEKDWSEESSNYGNDMQIEFMGKFEKAVSTLCFSESPGKSKETSLEVMNVWEMLNHKSETKYGTLRQQILHQLLDILSTSKEDKFIRASVSILLLLVTEDKTLLEDIKRKPSHLYDLARALKTSVHEASILIYMIKPSPSEIKDLDLLPALLEVACNSNSSKWGSMYTLSPVSASLSIIEILVTAFDHATNNMNLTTISSPQVLSKLVNVARNKVLSEGIALTAILVKCMRFNGNCRKFISQVTPVDPFLQLLRSKEGLAKCAALEYFHEILRMPRSSAIVLLHQIRRQGGVSIFHALMACIQHVQQEHKLLAANLLIQLDMLEDPSGKSIFKEEALDVLVESLTSEDSSGLQILSAFVLSNLGGTYAWTGEPYTAAWLAKKAGLVSLYNRNMIRNIDWRDPCLQETDMDTWSSKIAKGVLKFGNSVLSALAKGIESTTRSVSRDSLIATAWLGCEMAITGSSTLRYSACEMLISGVVRFLHPGAEFDERILACLCVYNFASGKGVQKLINFTEGVRESLRRLSGATWMAGELLKVTDYFIPTKPRVSCVHTQILEAGKVGSGAVTALIFYKGQLYGGYTDGSIKVWDVKGQTSKLVWEVKEHKKPITCFALFEPGDNLLSGSLDRTVKVWQMTQKKLRCMDTIEMKEPVHKINTLGDKILVATQSKGLKICRASKIIKTVCRGKHVKCLAVTQAKAYVGCTDSSVLEVDLTDNHELEIRSPANIWRIQNKPINSISEYKGLLYWADTNVEESNIKSTQDWRRHNKPQVSIPMERGCIVQEMAIVEDFIYLTANSSPSILQIWLRGKQQKVGRLSAGGKISSLLAANDAILCGTEMGLIKGWIPL